MDEGQWLDKLWIEVMDERDRAMCSERVAGRTLHEIGDQYGISRERVRQCLVKIDRSVAAAADMVRPMWRERLASVANEPAVSISQLATILDAGESVAVCVLAGTAGFVPTRVWGHMTVLGWRTAAPGKLDAVLSEIVGAAPLRQDELVHLPIMERLPEGLPIAELLRHSRSPLIQGVGGDWLRRAARGRDAAYLWMAERGSPCRTEDLAEVLAGKPHAVREALRRDERFTQIRPEGTWVLTEWSHPSVSSYSSAEEAMIAVLEEEGAMRQEQLFARVVERYPVTAWRLKQCLLSDRVGVTPNGHFDLIVRGAEPIEEPEPTQPKTMEVDSTGMVFGIRLNVNYDVVRGSGVVVNTWLTWKLGLRRARMSKSFEIVDSSDEVLTVRRGTSGAQVSSLRRHVKALDIALGCQIAILLRVDESTARIIHACPNGVCPTRSKSDS